jgi:Methyltransferase domain
VAASLRERLKKNPLVLFVFRIRTLWAERRSVRRRPGAGLRYLFRGRELSTFTFHLANREELAAFLGRELELESQRVMELLDELEADQVLREALSERLRGHPNRYDSPRYAKRCAYYALIRLQRPRLVVETGTHDGLGTSVMARALQRNAEESGEPAGLLYSFDINGDAGWLVPDFLEPLVRRHVGATSETLAPALEGKVVDLMLHDSLRTAANERFEFELAIEHAAPRLTLICDDVDTSNELEAISAAHGGSFAVFREDPADHFYRGDAMGLAILSR